MNLAIHEQKENESEMNNSNNKNNTPFDPSNMISSKNDKTIQPLKSRRNSKNKFGSMYVVFCFRCPPFVFCVVLCCVGNVCVCVCVCG